MVIHIFAMRTDLRREIEGLAFLLSVSLLWGTSFPLAKIIVSSVGTSQYVALRFALSALLLSPYLTYRLLNKRTELTKSIKPGILLGLIYFVGIWLQGLGMERTSASNAGFITSLNILIVYAVELLYYRRKYGHEFALAVILSIVGMYLMAGGSYESRIGDLLVLAGAFFWAFHVLAADSFSKRFSILDLVFVQYAITAALGLALSSQSILSLNWLEFLAILLYLATVCSILVGFLQLEGQSRTTASRAALVYSLEPVFAAAFSYLMLGESLGFVQLVGAALIVASLIVSLWGIAKAGKDDKKIERK